MNAKEATEIVEKFVNGEISRILQPLKDHVHAKIRLAASQGLNSVSDPHKDFQNLPQFYEVKEVLIQELEAEGFYAYLHKTTTVWCGVEMPELTVSWPRKNNSN